MPRPTATLSRELAAAAVGAVALLGALSFLGLGPVGWVAGSLAGAGLVALLAGSGVDALGPAGRVTLTRAVLAVGVTALVVDPVSIAALVGLAAVALLLDAVDGRVARRRGVASAFGARFDMEMDAYLLLVLSLHVAGLLGAWVLAIGLMRYAVVAARVVAPWMRGELPPRRSAKVVAALQGVVLVVATADVLPRAVTTVLVAGALAALVWSFAGDLVLLWRRTTDHPLAVRRSVAAVVTVLAALLVLAALVTPGDLLRLVPAAGLRIPLEVLVGVVVLVLLPPRWRRPVAAVGGALLGLVLVLTLLDLGFSATLARPFDPVADGVLLGSAVDFLQSTLGGLGGTVVAVLVALAAAGLVVATAAAVVRLARIARRRRSAALRAVAVLAVGWAVAFVAGAESAPGLPVAALDTSVGVVARTAAIGQGIRDQRAFAVEADQDAYRDVPADRLLTALRGHDVVVAVVESYGRAALEDPAMAGGVHAVIDDGARQLGAAGYRARSGFLTSPVAGGGSWLAHATLLSGLRIDNQQRDHDLLGSDRLTLTGAFHRAGWRTVAVEPGTTGAWPEAAFYGYDGAYAAADLGYRGPRFSWSPMPDQYALAQFTRTERGPGAPPTMAQIVLTSSHAPWTPLPRTVPWDAVGDGSAFGPAAPQQSFESIFGGDPAVVRADYRRSIEYSLATLYSWVQADGAARGRAPVLVVLGDHQPAPVVTGSNAGRDVPISIVTRDPEVLGRIAGWGWTDGLAPAPGAPVWPMETFRDRFLGAFGSEPVR